MLFQLVQIVYWLALATWFGGVLFIAVAAPIIFRTVREAKPLLPDVLSVNLENQHGTLLAGSIVGAILRRLAGLQVICGVVLLAAMGAQWGLIDLQASNFSAAMVRAALAVGATGLALWEWKWRSPRLWRYRQQYIENADDPQIANPAKEQFDRQHVRSQAALQWTLALLLGLILFSSAITPRRTATAQSSAIAHSAR